MDNARHEPVQPLSDHDAEQEARRLLSAWKTNEPAKSPLRATMYRDHSAVPEIGDTPPVPQPDARLVPAWATGTAVVSLAVGAGATGLGCAAWLALRGLALVSVPSLQSLALVLLAPFAGAALLAVTIGAAVARARRSTTTTTNVFHAPVTVTNKAMSSSTRGVFARTRNTVRP